MQDYRTAIDCSGLCINAARGVDGRMLASLVSAITGFELSESGLKEIGERVWNLERMVAVAEGIDRKYDRLPLRFFEKSLPDRSAKGAIMNGDGFERMLSGLNVLFCWGIRRFST